MKSFLSERHCKAFLNKESLYYRANIRAGVLQCSILDSIFFLTINDLPDGLLLTVKHFAELQLLFKHEICQNRHVEV